MGNRCALQNGDNKDKMVSGTSVKKKEKRRKKEITNVSQVRYENQDCLATAVQKKKKTRSCVVSREPAVLPPSGGWTALAGGTPALESSVLRGIHAQ